VGARAASMAATYKPKRPDTLGLRNRRGPWPGAVPWADVYGNGNGHEGQPIGTKCLACGQRHHRGFNWMSWETFCAEYTSNKAFKAAVHNSDNQGHVGSLFGTVNTDLSTRIEISRSVTILSESELCKALGKPRLPKHMRSVPTLTIPKVHDGTLDASAMRADTETVFCFTDPQQPYRKASLVVSMAASAHTCVLKDVQAEGQRSAVLTKSFREVAGGANVATMLMGQATKRLVPLDSFVDQKTACGRSGNTAITKRPSRVGAGGVDGDSDAAASVASEGHDKVADSESESSSSAVVSAPRSGNSTDSESNERGSCSRPPIARARGSSAAATSATAASSEAGRVLSRAHSVVGTKSEMYDAIDDDDEKFLEGATRLVPP